MPDLDNVTPVNQQQSTDTNGQSVVNDDVQVQSKSDTTPPPTNAERAEAKAAKEAAEKEAKEKADAAAAVADANSEDDLNADDDKELDTAVWGDAGDEVANSVLATLQNSGVTTDEAKALLWDAVEAGDPTKVDRDALVEKVGKDRATLIMAGIENVTSRNNARIEEVTTIANETAGSKENWSKATKWAVAKLPENELNELRDMLDKGGRQAKFAAGEIVARYNADPKNTELTAGKNQIKPDGKANTALKPITRREYGELLDKAHRTRAGEAAIQQLRARRELGKKQGI